MNLKRIREVVGETVLVGGTIMMLISPLMTLLVLIGIGVTIAVMIGT